MLPAKVRDTIRGLLVRRVNRPVRALREPASPDNLLAQEAKLIGDAGALLDPEIVASGWIWRREKEARRYARVCVWDGVCEADATTDDGLCAAHAEQQAKEDAYQQAEIDADIAALVAACREGADAV